MSIRESRQRSRRSRRGPVSASGPVPHSARTRRHNKLSLRRRRRTRVEPVLLAEVTVPSKTIGLGSQRLSELTGVSPAMEKQLHAMGHTRFFHIAHWSAATICEVADKLGVEQAQILESNWIGQARQRG
jgi:predicted flap endonuclease-1-like 5' DNA nuclease